MCSLELAVYKTDWRASWRYRRYVTEATARRDRELCVKRLQKEALVVTDKARRAGHAKPERRFGEAAATRLQQIEKAIERHLAPIQPHSLASADPVVPATVAARLLFARLFDSRPSLRDSIRSSAPIIAVEVPDLEMLDRILPTLQDILLPDPLRVMNVARNGIGARADHDAVLVAIREPPNARYRSAKETEALSALSLGLPLLAISPASETHLPEALLKAVEVRVTLPRLDPVTITRAIRIVTGRRCQDLLDETTAALVTPVDMIVAIRFNRTPAECLTELRRLVADKAVHRGARDISLDQLHGMDEAVAWAHSTIRDLEAWRSGKIVWSALDSGACLVGPPGTGKTLFAQCFSRAAGLSMVACSLAQWQGTDEGHLGHLLRAMRRDFDSARSRTPCLLFIDEIDSFADRSKVRHSHADYVVEVVNGFIAQLDGVAGREGLIFLAASNDIARCDPAILRSGRLNRIIHIGLPNVEQLERMFRVRLGTRLSGEDLSEICLLALGATGADVERIVKDAARFARHENRPLELNDLRSSLVDVEDRSPATLRRTAIHEAGHLLMEIILFGGAADVHATIANSGTRGGATIRTKPTLVEGTFHDYHARLQALLAGRAAEEVVLGEASHGAGGRRRSDLDYATALAAAMVASLGLAGPHRLLYLGPVENATELLTHFEVRAAAHAELATAMDACRSRLMNHRTALDDIAATLMRGGRIDGVTAAAIIDAHRKTKRDK